LDIEAREWLIRFLQGTRQAVLMVCHDRAVVNATADRVLELANGTLTEYSGNYDDMVRLKEVRNARQRETYEKQLAEERRLKNSVEKTHQVASSMTKRPTGRTYDPKAKAFYAGKEAKLDRRAKAIRSRAEQVRERLVEKPFEEESTALRFFAKPLRHPDALTVRGLRKSYGERELFGNLSITLGRGERVAVVGPNGAGKTTLFRILLGEENPDAGTVEWTSDAAPAFLSQARNALDPEKTILEALDPVGEEQIRFVRTLLARLRIRGDAVHKPVGVLSVGERTKVELVSMLMSPANVLLLDEPTNHLDVDSMDALESALKEFPGSVIFTSHDATFVERTADTVVRIGGAD
jgi:ATPase subunit of ABC transporter with duplicated ATPase domains